MGWGEALRMTKILAEDVSSQVGAALRGWPYPIERADAVLRDLFDKYLESNFKRPQPYPRPWHPQPKTIGGASLTPAEFRALRDSVAEQN